MASKNLQPWSAGVWELARRQHGLVTRTQLLALGMSSEAIRHRLATGRLHRDMRGVYVVGRPDLSARGRWMAAVLACGPEARLSHRSAAALWGIRPPHPGPIEVAVPDHVARRRPGLRVHRQAHLEDGRRRLVDGIPVTEPVSTLIDLASLLPMGWLEAAVNEADHLDLVDPETLRTELDSHPPRAGLVRLRWMLDWQTFVLSDTELERRFLRLVRSTPLPLPETQAWVNGYRVDFYWRDLGLVVEADSLRYHRTAAKQSADQRRDHAHVSAGLTTLRFSHAQVRYEPDYVKRTLVTNFERLRARG